MGKNRVVFGALCSLFIGLLLIGCGKSASQNNPTAQNVFKIESVDSYEFKFFDGREGGVIQFSATNIKMCSLLFAKEDFKAGFHAQVTTLGEGEVDLTCLADGKHYAMSDIVSTEVFLKVDGSNKEAILTFNLYDPRSKTYLARQNGIIKFN